jgi:hypothetical protein
MVITAPCAIRFTPYQRRAVLSGITNRHVRFASRSYLGLTISWIEGIELNFFGGVLGLDVRRPALKLPGLGRLGLPLTQ